ncbi:MAG: Transcriptional regulator, LuxR family protein [Labilithrix sp.]|nr:Transcriptional regulator, LuxR family protein [Labilithrix sp.]
MKGFVRTERAREAALLVREVAEIGARTAAARRHFKERLQSLVGAVISGAVDDLGAALHLPKRADVLTVDTPYHAAVFARVDASAGCEPFTATSAELVPQREWRRSFWVNEYVRPAGLDHFLGSHWRFPDGTIEGLGFMRAANDAPFDEDDRATLHLAHLGVGRLFEPRASDAPKLAPRVRETLDAVLVGATDKEIAARLGISGHTVRDYMKVLFRAYGVSSRAQLIAKLTRAAR